MSKFASDYIEVADRMQEFYARYPEGSLQGSWTWEQDGALIVYRAEAYRTPTDPRPGIGYAQEAVPGRTTFTKGSELMNAETSAWGRAMAALGIATKQGIATGHEVRMAKDRQAARPAEPDDMERQIARCSTVAELEGLVAKIKATPDPDKYRTAWATRREELTP